jgi:hypothetical protein
VDVTLDVSAMSYMGNSEGLIRRTPSFIVLQKRREKLS